MDGRNRQALQAPRELETPPAWLKYDESHALLKKHDCRTEAILTNIQHPLALLASPEAERVFMVGTLKAMCSREEMAEKQLTSTTNDLERLATPHDQPGRYVNEHLAVKSFQRSDASKVFLPQETRPVLWCRRTVHNILQLQIDADEVSQPWHFPREGNQAYRFIDVYNFVRDRLRGVWQDLTVQHCPTHQGAIESLEISCRFLLLAEELLCEEPEFNGVQNGGLISTCLDKLMVSYNSVREFQKTQDWTDLQARINLSPIAQKIPSHELKSLIDILVYESPFENEFWAYRSLLCLSHGDQALGAALEVNKKMEINRVQRSDQNKIALLAIKAYRDCNAVRYFKLQRKSPYLLAIAMSKFGNLMRMGLLYTLSSDSSKKQNIEIPFQLFQILFNFDDEPIEVALEFCTANDISFSQDSTGIVASVNLGQVRVKLTDLQPRRLRCRRGKSRKLQTMADLLAVSRRDILDPRHADPSSRSRVLKVSRLPSTKESFPKHSSMFAETKSSLFAMAAIPSSQPLIQIRPAQPTTHRPPSLLPTSRLASPFGALAITNKEPALKATENLPHFGAAVIDETETPLVRRPKRKHRGSPVDEEIAAPDSTIPEETQKKKGRYTKETETLTVPSPQHRALTPQESIAAFRNSLGLEIESRFYLHKIVDLYKDIRNTTSTLRWTLEQFDCSSVEKWFGGESASCLCVPKVASWGFVWASPVSSVSAPVIDAILYGANLHENPRAMEGALSCWSGNHLLRSETSENLGHESVWLRQGRLKEALTITSISTRWTTRLSEQTQNVTCLFWTMKAPITLRRSPLLAIKATPTYKLDIGSSLILANEIDMLENYLNENSHLKNKIAQIIILVHLQLKHKDDDQNHPASLRHASARTAIAESLGSLLSNRVINILKKRPSSLVLPLLASPSQCVFPIAVSLRVSSQMSSQTSTPTRVSPSIKSGAMTTRVAGSTSRARRTRSFSSPPLNDYLRTSKETQPLMTWFLGPSLVTAVETCARNTHTQIANYYNKKKIDKNAILPITLIWPLKLTDKLPFLLMTLWKRRVESMSSISSGQMEDLLQALPLGVRQFYKNSLWDICSDREVPDSIAACLSVSDDEDETEGDSGARSTGGESGDGMEKNRKSAKVVKDRTWARRFFKRLEKALSVILETPEVMIRIREISLNETRDGKEDRLVFNDGKRDKEAYETFYNSRRIVRTVISFVLKSLDAKKGKPQNLLQLSFRLPMPIAIYTMGSLSPVWQNRALPPMFYHPQES